MSTTASIPLVFAHRGASLLAPENSLAAFALAVHGGTDAIECDVQLTADGEVVVIHDDTLDATTDGHGLVTAMTLAQLSTLRLRMRGKAFDPAGTTERIPTLNDVIAIYGHGPHLLNVEIKPSKSTNLAEATARLVRAQGSEEFVLLSSFDNNALIHLQEHHANLRRAMNFPPSPLAGVMTGVLGGVGWLTGADALGCEAVHPNVRLASEHMVERAHALGLNVNVWTVDDDKTILHLADIGVDGVITNDAARVRALIVDHARARSQFTS